MIATERHYSTIWSGNILDFQSTDDFIDLGPCIRENHLPWVDSPEDMRNSIIVFLNNLGLAHITDLQAMDNAGLSGLCPHKGASSYLVDLPNSCYPGEGLHYITTQRGSAKLQSWKGMDNVLISQNQVYLLVMQPDCNLVRYKYFQNNPDQVASADSYQPNDPGCELTLQGDGNLVVYQQHTGAVHWAANNAGLDLTTMGPGPYKALLDNDGNMQLYNGDGALLWHVGWTDPVTPEGLETNVPTIDGQFCSPTGAMYQDKCLTWCTPCGPGTAAMGGVCVPCPLGTYRNESMDGSRCEICPQFSTTLQSGSIFVDDCRVPDHSSDLPSCPNGAYEYLCHEIDNVDFTAESIIMRPVIQLDLATLVRESGGDVKAVDGRKIDRLGSWYQADYSLQPVFVPNAMDPWQEAHMRRRSALMPAGYLNFGGTGLPDRQYLRMGPARANIASAGGFTLLMTMKHVNAGSPSDYQLCSDPSMCPGERPHCCAGRCVCDSSCHVENSADCLDNGACDDPADIPGTCAGVTANTIVSFSESAEPINTNQIEITRPNRMQNSQDWTVNVWNQQEAICSATFPMPEDEWKTLVVRYQTITQSLSVHKIPANIPYAGDGPIPDAVVLTFLATGCCNTAVSQSPIEDFRELTDYDLNDMFDYCELVRTGGANARQLAVCGCETPPLTCTRLTSPIEPIIMLTEMSCTSPVEDRVFTRGSMAIHEGNIPQYINLNVAGFGLYEGFMTDSQAIEKAQQMSSLSGDGSLTGDDVIFSLMMSDLHTAPWPAPGSLPDHLIWTVEGKCPPEYPYASTDPDIGMHICYKGSDRSGCTWCTKDISVGSGCSKDGSNTDMLCPYVTIKKNIQLSSADTTLWYQGDKKTARLSPEGDYIMLHGDELGEYLELGRRSFNIGSNPSDGGFTAIIAFRHRGTPKASQRLFDFGSQAGEHNNNIRLFHAGVGTSTYGFKIQLNAPSAQSCTWHAADGSQGIVGLAEPEKWAIAAVRYQHANGSLDWMTVEPPTSEAKCAPGYYLLHGNYRPPCASDQASPSACHRAVPEIHDDVGGWKLVRHLPPGAAWHPATDQLRGTETYGTAGDDNMAWSVLFDCADCFDEFLFASGDGSSWLIATKAAVIGENYANAPRDIIRSSTSDVPYQAIWYNRPDNLEDPFISLTDHQTAIANGQILYGGNSFGGSHAEYIAGQGGMNVFVRTSGPDPYFTPGRRGEHPSCADCAAECTGSASCASYQCSNSTKKCKLNEAAQPTPSSINDGDIAFCSKQAHASYRCQTAGDTTNLDSSGRIAATNYDMMHTFIGKNNWPGSDNFNGDIKGFHFAAKYLPDRVVQEIAAEMFVKKASGTSPSDTAGAPNQTLNETVPPVTAQDMCHNLARSCTARQMHCTPEMQWVAAVTAFSSQYSEADWAASQVVGAPDVYPSYGDYIGSWTVRSGDTPPDIHWLELSFDRAVEVGAVHVYETHKPGRLVKIQLLDENEQWDTVWTPPEGPEDSFLAARIFAPALEPRGYKTRHVRLEVDFMAPSGFKFYEIDAVSLVSACPRLDDGWLCSNTVSE